MMADSNARRQQLIQAAVADCPGDVALVATRLWQPLASELVSIVGEGGFHALFARSLYLAHSAFPWLNSGKPSRANHDWLSDLKVTLEEQDATEAHHANQMLLQIFTDILASLIGETLTVGILSSVWFDDATKPDDVAGKESPNE